MFNVFMNRREGGCRSREVVAGFVLHSWSFQAHAIIAQLLNDRKSASKFTISFLFFLSVFFYF